MRRLLIALVLPLLFYFIPVPFSFIKYLSFSTYNNLLYKRLSLHPCGKSEIARVPHDIDRKEFYEKYFIWGTPVVIERGQDTTATTITPALLQDVNLKTMISGENFQCDVSWNSPHRRVIRKLYDPPSQFGKCERWNGGGGGKRTREEKRERTATRRFTPLRSLPFHAR